MGIYILNFLLNMTLGMVLCVKGGGKYSPNELNVNIRKRRLYLIITTIQLGLLCGLRSTKMTYDTGAYKIIFELCPSSWENIFVKTSYVEIGFRILCSIIKILGGDFQTMLICTSLFIIGSCCTFIYRHSKAVVLSVFIIVCFPFYYSSFDTLRHFIAISFLFLGYKYIEEEKFFKFLVFIFIGSLFHKIVWLFLPIYYIKKIKWNTITMCVCTMLTILLYFFVEPIAIRVSTLLGKSSGVATGWIGSYGGGIKTALMYGALLIICCFAFYKLKDKSLKDMESMNFIALLFMSSVVFINARMMIRVITTLVVFLSVSIPNLLDYKRFRDKGEYHLLKNCVIIIGLTYHSFMLITNWQKIVPYVPFWR